MTVDLGVINNYEENTSIHKLDSKITILVPCEFVKGLTINFIIQTTYF